MVKMFKAIFLGFYIKTFEADFQTFHQNLKKKEKKNVFSLCFGKHKRF